MHTAGPAKRWQQLQQKHTAAAGLWNKAMSAVTASGTSCGAVGWCRVEQWSWDHSSIKPCEKMGAVSPACLFKGSPQDCQNLHNQWDEWHTWEEYTTGDLMCLSKINPVYLKSGHRHPMQFLLKNFAQKWMQIFMMFFAIVKQFRIKILGPSLMPPIPLSPCCLQQNCSWQAPSEEEDGQSL